MTTPVTDPPRVWSPGLDALERVLVIQAHPDDVDFSCAGTVATFVGHGIDVRYCIATDGEAGGNDRAMPRSEMAAIRRREQVAAAREVGVSEVIFLGHPDGRLEPSLDLRRDLSRVIRQTTPDLVISPSPQRNLAVIFASHPDHLAAGEAAMCAVYPDSRNPFAHPELLEEGLEPHTVGRLWLTGGAAGNVVVDITSSFRKKVAALACHQSQGGDGDGMEGLLSGWARGNAVAAGLGEERLAEQFFEIRTA
jgi:LmbE family N-acetylglucosaminyl deacetylase